MRQLKRMLRLRIRIRSMMYRVDLYSRLISLTKKDKFSKIKISRARH